MDYILSPSILSADFANLGADVKEAVKAGAKWVHIDVMDGKFVEKDTYNKMLEYASYIKRISNLPLDIHLMVEDVETGIEVFSADEPNIITFHLEACKDENEVKELIKYIKNSLF